MKKFNVSNKSAQEARYRDAANDMCYLILLWKFPHTHTHTCSEISYRITDVECITRAKTAHLNLTGMVG